MLVIPVLDLLGGHAVRAVRGRRDDYRPIRSPLAATSDPLLLAPALAAASAASTLYVADLDAILARGDHARTLAALRVAMPDIEIWLDAGFADYDSMRATFARIDEAATCSESAPRARLVPVFGTESLRDPNALEAALADGLAPILSLDYRAGQLVAPAACVSEFERGTGSWPARVIAMTLDQVGSYAGPDLDTFQRLRDAAPIGTTVIGAGGIRDRRDLAAAAQSGAPAWLIASALHDGRLDAER
ncbi:MAG TPA: HisA/HisF-related TIM barrel protein [Casimicrobiaceae bacterium]|uniref:HisA/HisF-related TIM barrel protein n=1 Tax=Trinickia sp. TaxID=2571163 RepID=UPI002C80335A|nr:HisA/HisF-related TIM barrel protein [Casimicrobiaceae bacterium]